MKVSKQEKAEAVALLREAIQAIPVDKYGKRTIYANVVHVSASGMQRQIKLYAPSKDGSLQWLSGWASKALGWSLGKHDGVKVDGCGMDMCFHLVDCIMHACDIAGTRGTGWQQSYRVEQL